jgi:hypothetical protein
MYDDDLRRGRSDRVVSDIEIIASTNTDIPTYYSKWLREKITAGLVLVRAYRDPSLTYAVARDCRLVEPSLVRHPELKVFGGVPGGGARGVQGGSCTGRSSRCDAMDLDPRELTWQPMVTL